MSGDRGQETEPGEETSGVELIPLEGYEEPELDVEEELKDPIAGIEADLREALDSAPPFRQTAYLDAAHKLVESHRLGEAERVLDSTDVSGLAPALAARKRLLRAEVYFYRNDLDRARRLAARTIGTGNVDPTYIAGGLDLKARIDLLQGRPLEAATAWIRRDSYLTDAQALAENHERIWYALGHLNELELQLAGRNDTAKRLRGWLDLAILFLEFGGDRHGLRTAVTRWSDVNPAHPAAEFAAALLGPARAQGVRQIGLLLPLSSSYGAAARMVYNGFDAAHQTDRSPRRPRVMFYDTGGETALVGNYVGVAVTDGADVIVGPLGKTAVSTLLATRRPEKSMVLLGSTDSRSRSTTGDDRFETAPETKARRMALLGDPDAGNPSAVEVYQFDLAPEPEARQVAQFMYASGHRRVAALYPDDEWGRRVYDAFAAHWRKLGGTLAGVQRYAPDSADFTAPIKNLFNLSESETRAALLEARSGLNLVFESRRRHDIDALFMAARPDEARLLKPQINFFRGYDLPVYSTSRVYTGTPDPDKDADLEGITFPDMPWLLRNTARIDHLKATLQSAGYSNVSSSLFAFGFDAYHLALLAPDSTLAGNARLSGLTSDLILGKDGRIYRRPDWATFKDGVPVLTWGH